MISLAEIIHTAFRALWRNKTRSFLTTLGIIIGVGAVIAAFAVGAGANKVIDEQISSLGTNSVTVMRERNAQSTGDNAKYLTTSDAEAIAANVSGVEAVAPLVGTTVQVVYGNTNWSTTVYGSTTSYADVQGYTIEKGRNLTESDQRTGTKVAVIGNTVAEKLFPHEDPLGKSLRIAKVPFTVVGVFAEKGQSTGGFTDQDDLVLVPLKTAQSRLVKWNNSPGRVSFIQVKGVSMESLSYITSEITQLMRERHKIRPGHADDFAVRSLSQMLEARRKTTNVTSMLLASIAVISLVVGGIGIMNIMLVSVTERTREIGIRMAVGAKSGNIKIQFLIESVTLSLIGGAIGICAGIGAGYALASFTQAPPVFTLSSIALAFLFSAAVGVGFGYYPAAKASMLNPIDALKYE
ncbi:MAG: ABC transporter permease [Pyramidobacter sp.]|jgi:putative ABC transport system permease protein